MSSGNARTLTVQFKGARQLFNTSSWGSQSPYARCWTSTTRDNKFEGRVSTSTGTSAVWNDTATLSVANVNDEYFFVEIKAKGRLSDSLIGRLKVSCAELPVKDTEMTLKVITESGENGGELHLVISCKGQTTQQYTTPTAASRPAPTPAPAPVPAPAPAPRAVYSTSAPAPAPQTYSVFPNRSAVQPAPVVAALPLQPPKPTEPEPVAPVKSAWRSTVHSASGKTFWYNTETKVTSWEMPAELAPAPPAAPSEPAYVSPAQNSYIPVSTPAAYISAGQYVRSIPVPSPAPSSYVPASAPVPQNSYSQSSYTQSVAAPAAYVSPGQYVRSVPVPERKSYAYTSAPAPEFAPSRSAYGSQSSSYTQSYSTNYPGQQQESSFGAAGAYPGNTSNSSAFSSDSSSYPGQTSQQSAFGESYYPGQSTNTFGENTRNTSKRETYRQQQPTKRLVSCASCSFDNTTYATSGTLECEMCGQTSWIDDVPQTQHSQRMPHMQTASYGPPPLPEFWEERSSNGKPYYVNHMTKCTTWTRPT